MSKRMVVSAVCGLLVAALPIGSPAQQSSILPTGNEPPPGKVEYQKAQAAQSVAVNLTRRAQASLNKPGSEDEAKKELGNAVEMLKLSRDTAASAIALEKQRALDLQASAAEQKKKAEESKDKDDLARAESAAAEAKRILEKVAKMEKTHASQSEVEQAMTKLQGSLRKGDESAKALDGLLKKVVEIDQAMAEYLS
jgi:hypothetical protein